MRKSPAKYRLCRFKYRGRVYSRCFRGYWGSREIFAVVLCMQADQDSVNNHYGSEGSHLTHFQPAPATTCSRGSLRPTPQSRNPICDKFRPVEGPPYSLPRNPSQTTTADGSFHLLFIHPWHHFARAIMRLRVPPPSDATYHTFFRKGIRIHRFPPL